MPLEMPHLCTMRQFNGENQYGMKALQRKQWKTLCKTLHALLSKVAQLCSKLELWKTREDVRGHQEFKVSKRLNRAMKDSDDSDRLRKLSWYYWSMWS